MKTYRKYIVIMLSLFGILIAMELAKPKPVDWRETYSKEDKIPYGSYILFEELQKLYAGNKIIVQDDSPYEYIDEAEEIAGGKSNFIIIHSKGGVDDYEWEKMEEYVRKGNNLFVAASGFNRDILEKWQVTPKYYEKTFGDDTVMYTSLVNKGLQPGKKYNYPFTDYYVYFDIDSNADNVSILGLLNNKYPDFIAVTLGKGKVYINTHPKAFGNINLLKDDNYEYAFKALSYLPQQALLWDEFYKENIRREETGTPLKYILKQPAFRWAYYTLIAGIILFFFFRARRTQRAIPIIKPLENSSLEFTETIGRLYFNRGNHKDIATKKIQYFAQHIQARYGLRFRENDTEFLKNLAEKSGLPEKSIQYLFWKINKVRQQPAITAQELFELNEKIDTFYNTAK